MRKSQFTDQQISFALRGPQPGPALFSWYLEKA